MPQSPRLLRPSGTFTPKSISGLALWLDAADASSLYTTDAGPVTAVSAPTEISGCVGWYDASDTNSITQSGGLVSQWNDKSGQGNHATQATSGSRPGVTTINGLNAISFNGTTFMSASRAASSTHTVLGVIRPTSTMASGSSPFCINDLAGLYVSNDQLWWYQRSDGSYIQSSTTIGTSACVLGYTNNAAAVTGYKNGLSAFSGTASADVSTASGLVFGKRGPAGLVGGFGELIVFNSVLSTTDRARVEAYLAAKWGIAGVHAQATATSDPVGYWRDKGPNGLHFTQATGANRGAVSTSLFGKRAIAFDGTSDVLSRAGVNNGAITNATGAALFWVVRPNNDTGYSVFHNAPGNSHRDRDTAGNSNPLYFRGSRLEGIMSGQLPTNSAAIYCNYVSVAGGAQTVRLNGAQRHVESFASATEFSFWRSVSGNNVTYLVGNGPNNDYLNGEVAEVIQYGSDLSLSQVQRIERYLAAKWGITLAPIVSNADAQDWVNRVYQNGGTVSSTTATAVNTFCDAIDAAGVRGRFYRLNLFCGTGLNACLVPLYRGPSLAGTQYGSAIDINTGVGPFVSADYTEVGGGLTGNGTSKYLQTGVRGDQLPAGFEADCHLSVYRRTAGNGQTLISSYHYNTVTATDRHNYEITQDTNCILGRETGGQPPAGAAYPRFNLSTRSSSTSMVSYANGLAGVEFTAPTAGVATGVPFVVLCRNLVTGNPPGSGGHAPTFYSSATLGSYSIGRSMSSGQVTAYTNAINAFMAALGRNV